MKTSKIYFLTFLAMIAFASNSLLCRFALKETGIDAATFTLVRILSGALALWIVLKVRKTSTKDGASSSRADRGGSWGSALALFSYAAAFSFAYNTLSAGTGALLLFGAVQSTMILWGLRQGEKMRAIQLAGIALALGGLTGLVFPGLSAPPFGGSILMLGAGVAWGVYSLRGKGGKNPMAATAGNFLRAVPFAAVVSLIFLRGAHPTSLGIAYAVVSGAITSGLGYVIWYAALPWLRAASAATVQLSVPVLAAAGGILFLHEPITLRFLFASSAVLGGIALVVIEKQRTN